MSRTAVGPRFGEARLSLLSLAFTRYFAIDNIQNHLGGELRALGGQMHTELRRGEWIEHTGMVALLEKRIPIYLFSSSLLSQTIVSMARYLNQTLN